MKRFFSKFSLAIAMLCVLFSSARSEEITLGTSTTTTNYIFYRLYQDGAGFYLYDAASILAAGGGSGSITSLALNVSNITTGSPRGYNGVTISMQNSTLTEITGPVLTGFTTVYSHSGVLEFTSTGWYTFNFQTPFEYDNTKNLLVKICFDNDEWNSNYTYFYANTSTNKGKYFYYDNINGCTSDHANSFSTTVLPNIKLNIEMGATINSVYPGRNAVLSTGVIYQTAPHKPGVKIRRKAGDNPVRINYQIRGPKPSTNVVYTALGSASDTNSTWVNIPTNMSGSPPSYTFDYRFGAAKGLYALIDPNNPISGNNGGLDLFTRDADGGEYEVVATLRYQPPFEPNYVKTYVSPFFISLANDIAITEVMEPRVAALKKFPAFIKTPIKFEVKNVGANPITDYKVYVKVKKDGMLVWQDSIRRTYPATMAQPLLPTVGTVVEYELKDFIPAEAGLYDIEIQSVLLSANDESPGNNFYPQAGQEHKFLIVYDQEPSADSVITPAAGSLQYVGRPVRPAARFGNAGITDMSNVRVRIEFENLNNPGVILHRDTTIAQDIPAGVVGNYTDAYFPKSFIAPAQGPYRACIYVDYPRDPVPDNNSMCITFNVSPSLSGNYTIGSANSSSPRNYPTIQAAVDDLFLKGVEGPVNFELTDASYDVGSTTLSEMSPALDFRSKIYGVSATNVVTFRPSQQRASSRGSVRINLITNSGVGIQFGQSDNPTNSNASIKIVEPSLISKYSNSDGYIAFDGGSQKSLLFTLQTNVPYRTVFYMLNSTNITVKNCIITDGLNQPASFTCELPNNRLSTTEFYYDKEWDAGVRSYSAAVVLRSIPPADEKFQLNIHRLDTIATNSIQVIGNEISNFGYGIISNGMGMLIKNGNMTNYYNRDNKFNGNTIYNISAMGIFVGFEMNTRIEQNRIHNVTGSCGSVAAGISVGTQVKETYLEYSNTGIYMSGNEISNVVHNKEVYGIRVRQVRLPLIDIAGKTTYFPDRPENVITVNNLIWGINAGSDTANKFGVRYYTKRAEQYYLPLDMKYFTKNDRIVNNTIIVDDDDYVNKGIVAGLSLEQTKNTFMYNNAISMLDNSLGNNQFAAAVIYIGCMPKQVGSSFNRNVFWVSNPGVTPIYRFVQTTDSSTILDMGRKGDFVELPQWQYWTEQDIQSAFGDFQQDMVALGSNPPYLRIKSDPYPIGSVLNNRGERLEEVTYDIDGKTRGLANQRYDIGAVEFEGRLYNNDMEVMSTTWPANYKESVGMFSDAEYVMTTPPVGMRARVRNSGSTQLTNFQMKVSIYRETPSEYGLANFVGDLEKSKTIPVTISSTDDMEIDFLLDDNNGLGDDWIPKTYADLRGTGYTVPPQFASMQPNVTPRYRLVLSVDNTADEMPSNNAVSKYVRFYLKRSGLDILVSAENSHIDINTIDANNVSVPLPSMTDKDQIAGRLNFDSLMTGFRRMGYVADYTSEVPRYDIDVFERNGWEPRAVNYTMYKTLIWSDGNDNRLDRFQSLDLDKFFGSLNLTYKKNFIAASQELIRLNQYFYPFVRNELRTMYDDRDGYNAPFYPLVHSDQRLVGWSMARDLETTIKETGWVNNSLPVPVADAPPMVVYNNIYPIGDGFSRIGMFYKNPTNVGKNDKIMGIVTTTLRNNIMYFGLDWRHFGDPEFILRAAVDFLTDNEGYVIPIELLSFDANAAGNRVELNWTTASEQNSSRFDVERANVEMTGTSAYVKVDEVKSIGNSTTASDYSTIDRNVKLGSTYSYRLKMIDVNGEFKYSDERLVTLTSAGLMSVGEVRPNPANAEAIFDIYLESESHLTAELFDINGKSINLIDSGLMHKGANELKIDTKNLSSGTYTIVIRSGEAVITKQFNVAR